MAYSTLDNYEHDVMISHTLMLQAIGQGAETLLKYGELRFNVSSTKIFVK